MPRYDITAQKAEILEDIVGVMKDLELGMDETKLYATTAIAKDKSQLLTLSYGPLKIEHTLPTEKSPGRIYFLSQDTMALVSYNWVDEYYGKGGSIILLNVNDYKQVQKMEFKKGKSTIYTRWFKKERVLIIIDGFQRRAPEVYKVSTDGIIKNKAKDGWLDFKYLPDLDRLYLVGVNYMEEFDFPSQQQQKNDIGINISSGNNVTYYYQFFHIPDTDTIAVYCSVNGNCKFYSITEHTVMAKVTSGRPGKKMWSMRSAQTEITVNQDKTRIYMICVASKDITVFDSEYNMLHYIIPENAPLRIFQVKKPVLQTLVATVKGLSVIGSDSKTIESIIQYSKPAEWANFYEDENKILFWTDKEFFVLKKETFEVTAHYGFYSGVDESVRNQKLRYRFLYNLE